MVEHGCRDRATRGLGDHSPRRRVPLSPRLFLILLIAQCSLLTAFASSWTRQNSTTMAWLRSAYFLDQNRGWVAGSNGTLLHTTDGGEVWKKLPTLTKDALNDVYFADDNAGWILADRDQLKINSKDEPRSYLMKTEDGGLTWQRVVFNTADANP